MLRHRNTESKPFTAVPYLVLFLGKEKLHATAVHHRNRGLLKLL